MLKRTPLIIVCSTLAFYLASHLLVSFQYEKKVGFFYRQSESLFRQLKVQAPLRAANFTKDRKVAPVLEKPTLAQPMRLIPVFFQIEDVHLSIQRDLQEMLTFFKGQLKGLDLSGLIFSGHEKILSQADLRKTILKQAKLESSDFTQANLGEANLQGARLRTIRLNGANLRKANLSNVDLRSADLSNTDLRDTNLFYADFVGANLSQSNLRGLKMSAADFRKVDFRQADLSQAVLGGARLDEADFSDAKLEGADLRYADLSKTIGLVQAQLSDVLIDHNTTLPDWIQITVPSRSSLTNTREQAQ